MDALLAVANVSDRGRQDCTLLKRSVNVDLTAHVVRFFWLVACTIDTMATHQQEANTAAACRCS